MKQKLHRLDQKRTYSTRHKMIIIGIDPGTLITGFGIIELKDNGYKVLDYGCIKPPAKLKLSERYLIIFEGIEILLERYKVAAMAIETQYVCAQKNVHSAIKVGMARAVAIVSAKKKKIATFEYTPAEAKKAVSGYGQAAKGQVQAMVKHLLALPASPPADAADALALAICHAQRSQSLQPKTTEV